MRADVRVIAGLILGLAALAGGAPPLHAEGDFIEKSFPQRATEPYEAPARKAQPPRQKPQEQKFQDDQEQAREARRRAAEAKRKAAAQAAASPPPPKPTSASTEPPTAVKVRPEATSPLPEPAERAKSTAALPIASPLPPAPQTQPIAPTTPMGLGAPTPERPAAEAVAVPAAPVRPPLPFPPAASEVPPKPMAPPAVALRTEPPLAPAAVAPAPQASPPERQTGPDPLAAAIERGERAWLAPRGPTYVGLETCDLGAGPGRVADAIDRLPTAFADAGRVMDLEARVLWCIERLEPAPSRQPPRRPPGAGRAATSEIADLLVYLTHRAERIGREEVVATGSAGVAAPLWEAGRQFYVRRQGPLDLSCTTCHQGERAPHTERAGPRALGPGGTRPDLVAPTTQASANSPDEPRLATLHERLRHCFWRMHLPEPDPGAPVLVALTGYLTRAPRVEAASAGIAATATRQAP